MAVELVQVGGNDLLIVNAARVSYAKEGKFLHYCPECERVSGESNFNLAAVQQSPLCPYEGCFGVTQYRLSPPDIGLINYLAREKHGTPFEMVEFWFRVTCPIGVAREWQRHRIACLSGDTRLVFDRKVGEGSRVAQPFMKYTRTVEEIYHRWRPAKDRSSRSQRQGSRLFAQDQVRTMLLRSCNESTGEITHTSIAEVWQTGVQPAYKVTLENGYSLTMTENHRVMTDAGWLTLRQAIDPEFDRKGRLRWRADTPQFAVNGVRTTVRRKAVWTPEMRRRQRALRSGPNSNFWKGGVSTNREKSASWACRKGPEVFAKFNYICQACGERGGRLVAHHLDPVWHNPVLAMEFENLVALHATCHKIVHASNLELELLRCAKAGLLEGFAITLEMVRPIKKPKPRQTGLRRGYSAVAKVEYVGEIPTYDIEVEGPWHNFVANGFIVHNSYNEVSTRYVEMAPNFYVPLPENVRIQVGKPGHYQFEVADDMLAFEFIGALHEIYRKEWEFYKKWIDRGIAKELVRNALPLGLMTSFYFKTNLRSLFNFMALRTAPNALLEIRLEADQVEAHVREAVPIAYEAWNSNGRSHI